MTNGDWEKLVERELGTAAAEEFHRVMDGGFIEPSQEWFNGAFSFAKGPFGTLKTGYFDDALIWKVKEGKEDVQL